MAVIISPGVPYPLLTIEAGPNASPQSQAVGQALCALVGADPNRVRALDVMDDFAIRVTYLCLPNEGDR